MANEKKQAAGAVDDTIKGYAPFKVLPPGGPLNRWSHFITNGHDFPGAQVRRLLPSASMFVT